MKKASKKLVGVLSLVALASNVYGAGYKLEFASPAILAGSGEAAAIEDASTNWYNSAGLVYVPKQLVMSAIDVYAPVTFHGTAVAPSAIGAPFAFAAAGRANSYSNSVIPALHVAVPINNRVAVGYGVVPAWGFMEDYGENSILRYDLTRIYTRSVDINASIAYKINNHWSVGIGPNADYFTVQSKSHARTEGPFPFGTATDSISRFTADNWSWGFHAGLLFRLDEATRVGLNYRSKIVQNLKGFSDFEFPAPGPGFESRSFKLRANFPPTTTLSFYRDINPRWAILGTVNYDQWSVLKAYNASGYITPTAVPGVPALLTVSLPQKFQNTFDYSIGTHYRLDPRWLLRASFKYEPTPTRNAFRDINFPDAPKYGLNFGARFQMNPKLAFDLLYGHVFTTTVPINGFNPVSLATTTGHAHTNIDVAGASVVWNM